MLGRLILLLTLVPIAELFLVLTVHGAISEHYGWRVALGVSIGSILVTGLVGALLARSQGVAAVQTLRATLARGEFPGTALMDAVMIVAGGAMLLTPGYITDVLGLTLLIPPTRAFYRRLFEKWLRGKVARGEAQFRAQMGSMDHPGQTAQVWSPPEHGEVIIEETFAPEPGEGDPGHPPSGSSIDRAR